MRGRMTLIVLAVVFAILALLTIAQSNAPSPFPTATVRPIYRVFDDLAVLEMQAIRVYAPDVDGAALLLARAADGTWARPDGQPVAADTASSIARTIALLPYQRTLTVEGGDLRPYGFLPRGIFAIEVVLTDGSTHAVEIGDLAVSNTAYYAVVDDRPDIYVLDRPAVDYLIQQFQLRDTPPTPAAGATP